MTAEPLYAIDTATAVHLDAICRIEQRVSPFAWTRREISDSLTVHQGLVLRRDRKVIGFAFFHQVLDEAELLNLAVDTSFQGAGLGARLLRHCFAQLREPVARMFLEVRVSNFAAIALYLGNGFVKTGERASYYWTDQGAEDALIMCRHFEPVQRGPA